jgi:hypothetical protein
METHIPGGYAPELSSHDLTVKMPDGFRREPSDQVIENLKFFVRRSRRSRGVQLARSFVRRENTPEAVPPLALLLRGGQGGEVRLKLYLTMLLLAVQPPFDIRDSFPARSWAAALGLDDPARKGARRIGDAISWLAEHKFIVTERRRGTPGSVRLLSQDLSGDPYERPAPGVGYVSLPLGIWDKGWIVRLSGTALVMLIVLLDMQGGRTQPQWISPPQARRRYDLSADTWTKGLKELRALDLVTVTRRPQGNIFNHQRVRNAYWVHEELLRSS